MVIKSNSKKTEIFVSVYDTVFTYFYFEEIYQVT